MRLLQIFMLLAIPFCLLCSTDAKAQGYGDILNPDKQISQYTLRKWDTEAGLPAIAITDIYQASDGYLWLGTYNGLSKFDGIKFTNYSAKNNKAFSSSSVKVLYNHGDTLWVGTQKGIICYAQHQFHRLPELRELDAIGIEDIHLDKKGRLWIGTTTKGLFYYFNGKLVAVEDPQFLKSPVLAIKSDALENLWIGTDKGELYSYKEGQGAKKILSAEETQGISGLFQGNQQLWLGSNAGVFQISGGAPQLHPMLNMRSVGGLAEDRAGNIWLANNNGLYRYKPQSNTVEHFSEKEGLPNNVLRKITFDHEGNLWIASYRSGLYQLTDGIFDCFTENEGLEGHVATSILPMGNQQYWIGTESGTVGILEGSQIQSLRTSKPIPSPRIKHLMKDSNGFVWISTYAGLMQVDKSGTVIQILDENSRFIDAQLQEERTFDLYSRMIVEDKSGHIWVGTRRKGLFLIKNGQLHRQYDSSNGLPSNFIMSITPMRDGSIWVGSKNGIVILKDQEIVKRLQKADGLPSNMIFSVYEDSQSVKWVASDLGVARIEEDSIFIIDSNKGLHENVVFDIVGDQQGYFWMTSNSGVSRVSKFQLEQLIDGRISSINTKVYDKADGMKSEECVGACKMTVDNLGNIWIPTVEGVAKINPAALEEGYKTYPMFIERIQTEQGSFYPTPSTNIQLPPGQKRLSLHFTAFNYQAPKKLRFRCKLMPFDQDWIPIENDRSITYTNLPPQNYSFVLQATEDNKPFDENNTAKLSFKVSAFFYQTPLFYAIALIMVALAIYGGYLGRVRVLRKNEEELQRKIENRTQEIRKQRDRIQSQHIQLEETIIELKDAQDRLVQSEKLASIGQLTAGIAHEINNPINFIGAGVDALKKLLYELRQILTYYEELESSVKSKDSSESVDTLLSKIQQIKEEVFYDELQDDMKSLISDIEQGVVRTTEIVKSLRTFSRDDSDELTQTQLSEIMDATLIILRNLYKDRVEVHTDYQQDPYVMCHAGKLGQVFSNIITNAIQAIQGKGEIHISIYNIDSEHPLWPTDLPAADAKYVQVAMRDSGPGIEEEVLQKIFDPFFTTKDVGSGTGLGLSISYGIIQKHKGTLSVDSMLGKGTAFYITLPLNPQLIDTKPNA